MIRFLDTNAVLNTDLSKEDNIVLSSITLEELESIKTNRNKTEELRYKARKAIHWLDKNSDKYKVIVYDKAIERYLLDKQIEVTPDSKIVACAAFSKGLFAHDEYKFVTDDICCKVLARDIFGLNVESIRDQQESIYKGYKIVRGGTDVITKVLSETDDWYANEYAIIQNTDDNTESEMRFDGEKFVALKLPPSKFIKGRNALQRCALDMLMNPSITICAVLGGYGSGKTALTTKMSIFEVQEKGHQSKINMVREPVGEGHEIGFLKGDFEDKTEQFFLPLVQQLDGGEFELESLKQQGVIEAFIPYYCKGLTFNDSITVVDEAEDLDEKQIRLIGTRIGENSRIFFNGDYKQSLIKTTEDNALIKMCNHLKGDPMFATVYLGEDVRSMTSKLFAHIFED